MAEKLIIWDFDGVIADTEHGAVYRYYELLKDFGINITLKQTIDCIMGKSQQMQLESLSKYTDKLNIYNIKEFNKEADIAAVKNLKLTAGIEEIFKMQNFEQCIATGNSFDGIKSRIYPLNLDKYITKNHIFSADLVERGKPEPDLFLYAAEKMGYKPENSIIIEDSMKGLLAGIRADIKTIAYIEHCLIDKKEYTSMIKKLGIDTIFDNMYDLKKYLKK